MLHTVHTTRLYKCCAQPVWLNKHSTKKKEELYVPKRQHRWWSPLSVMLMWFFLTEQQAYPHWHYCHSHCLRWQWEHHCCVQNSEQCGHTTCSYCNTHWNVLMYNNILKRVSYCVFNSQYNWQKSTHSDSESELHWCITVNEFSSAAMWYSFVQTECCHWAEWEWLLSDKSEHTKQAAVD